MGTNIRFDMLEASNPKQAALEQAKHALTIFLKNKFVPPLDREDDALLCEARENLISSLHQLRVVDIAVPAKDFIEGTDNDAHKRAVLILLEARIDSPETTINDNVIDSLALASIYESVDEKKSRELNAQAYFYLGRGQNNRMDRIISTLEHIQMYYSDTGDERETAGEFTLSISQMQDLDSILVVKTKDFLAEPTQDEDLADRLAYLLESHEDEAVSTPLLHRLFEVRSEAGRAEYIQSLLDTAAGDGVNDDDVVTDPILARAGKTYGELFQKVGHMTCARERLNAVYTAQASFIPA